MICVHVRPTEVNTASLTHLEAGSVEKHVLELDVGVLGRNLNGAIQEKTVRHFPEQFNQLICQLRSHELTNMMLAL